MKLHLPKRLFTALLTAITLAAAPAALTLGSAAWGEVITIVNGASMPGDDKNVEGNTFILDFSNNEYLWSGSNNQYQIYADVQIENAQLDDGFSPRTYTFHGDISGDGDFSFNKSGVYGQHYIFKGDMSAYSGKMAIISSSSLEASDFTFDSNLTGTGAIEVSGNHNYVRFKGATVQNSTVTTTNLQIGTGTSKSETVVGRVSAAGVDAIAPSITTTTLTIDSGATLNLVNGNLTIGSAITNSGTLNLNAKMTVNEGTSVSMTSSGSGKTYIGGSITNNGTLKLNSTESNFIFATEHGQITNAGIIDMSGLFKGKDNSGNNNGDHGWDNTTKQFTSLINAISGGEVILTGAADAHSPLTLQLGNGGTEDPDTVTFAADYKAYGNLTLANYNEQTLWKVTGSLTVYGASRSDNATRGLAITNLQKLLIVDGARVQTTGIRLGHFNVNAEGGHLEMTGGELTTGNIIMRSNSAHSSISITGGSVEFTDATAVSWGQGSPTIAIGGTGEKSVTLKATQTNWTLGATNLATSIGNITIDAANTHSITLQHASFNGTITNNTANESLLILGEGAKVKADESLTLNGNATFSHTITNDGTLTLNGTIYLAGDIDSTYELRGQGGTSYALAGGTDSTQEQNGFKTVEGASYYLTQSSNGVSDAKNNMGNKVVYHGTTSYIVYTDDSKGLYFSTGDMTGTLYYITTGGVVVNKAVQDAATGYTLQGGNMQLTEGSVNTGTITYDGSKYLTEDGVKTGIITVASGAELVLDGVPAGMTVNSLLSSILSSTSAGNVKIAQSGLDTYDGEGSGHADYSLDSAFAGTLELAAGVGFTLGNGNENSYSENAVITLGQLSGMKLNDGSTLYYNASGVTTIKNLQVVDAASATIHFKDSKSANAVQFAEKTQLDGDLTLSTKYDGGITFANLVGDGSLTGSSGDGTFKTTISSLQYTEGDETSTFTGSLSFSGGSNVVEVSTGSGKTISFVSLSATNVNSLTFNVQTDTTIGLLSAASGTVNVSANKTLTLGGGTADAQKQHSIGTLTVANGGKLSLAAHSTLTLENSQAITYLVSGAGELVVEDGVILTLNVGNNPDNKKFDTNVRIQNGGRMEFTGTDVSDQLNYGNSRTVYLEGTAELALGNTRQTVGNWTFDMTGGTISGKGMSGNLYALDFHRTGSIVAHAATGATLGNPTVSTVSANIKNRDGNGSQLNLVVDENARLNLTGDLRLEKPVEKSGAGLAVISGTVTRLGEVYVTGGTLELQSSVSTGSAISVGSGAELEISAGTSTLSGGVTNSGAITVSSGSATLRGAVTNNGAITVSGGTADFTNTLGMGTGSSLSVSGGTATVSGALNVTGTGVQISQSGNGVLNLTGSMSVGAEADATLSGSVGIAHTITNNGSLTLNGSLYLTGDFNMQAYEVREAVGETNLYSLSYTDTSVTNEVGNGFKLTSGGSFWLVKGGETDLNGLTTLNGYTVTQVTDTNKKEDDRVGDVYISADYNASREFYISSGSVEVDANVRAVATGYTLQGGTMNLQGGSVATSNITYTSGSVALSDAATLIIDVADNTTTATHWLTNTTGTAGTTIEIAANANFGEVSSSPSVDKYTTSFSGKWVVSNGATLKLGGLDGGWNWAYKVNLLSLESLDLDGGNLRFFGDSGKLGQVNVKQNARFDIHEMYNDASLLNIAGLNLSQGATLTMDTEWGSHVNIAALSGAGTLQLESGRSASSFLATVTKDFTGSLSFAGSNNAVTVSTGTESAISFTSLSATDVNSFEFNVLADTSIGSLATASGTVNVSANNTLTLGGGTAEAQAQHSIGTLSAASAVVTLDNYATLTLGDGSSTINHTLGSLSTASNSTVSISSGSNLTLSSVDNVQGDITGAGKLTLDFTNKAADKKIIKLDHAIFGRELNTLVLTGVGTGLETTSSTDSQHTNFGKIQNINVEDGATFYNRVTSYNLNSENNINISLAGAGNGSATGAALSLGYDCGSGGTVTFGDKVNFSLSDDATVIVHGRNRGNSADIAGVINTTIQGNGHTLTKIGTGKLTLENGASNTSLNVNEGELVLKGAATTSERVELNGGTLKLADQATVATITGKQGSAATMSKVQMSSTRITGTAQDGSSSMSNADIEVLAQDATFTIADMTLTNTSITAASVNIVASKVSGNVVLNVVKPTDAITAPNVGQGGTVGEMRFTYGLALVDSSSTLTLNMEVPQAILPSESGLYNLTITLNGFAEDFDFSNIANQVVFGADSWLGKALQGATPVVTNGSTLGDGAAAAQSASGAPSVSYNATSASGGNVGSLVITINGLNVPEPTTATLSLLALAALAGRRRRK